MKRHLVYTVKDDDGEEMTGGSVRYQKLKSDDGFSEEQYRSPPPKVPWSAIGLAMTLFFFGTLLIVIGSLLFTGIIDADLKYRDRMWPLLILGSLMFIPGAYHVRLAYYAYQGYRGYSYDDIPDFD